MSHHCQTCLEGSRVAVSLHRESSLLSLIITAHLHGLVISILTEQFTVFEQSQKKIVKVCLFMTCFVSLLASTKISIYIHNFRLKHQGIKRYCSWLPPTISVFSLSFCWRCPFLISISVKQDNFGVFVPLPSYGEVFSLDQNSPGQLPGIKKKQHVGSVHNRFE